MMQVLDFAYHHVGTNDEFISALPIAGIDGTLKHRMYNIARKVRAKTGTMAGSGWTYKELEDKIATLLTQYQRS